MGRVVGARLEEDAGGQHVRIVVGLVGRVGPIDLVLEGDSLLEAAAGFEARVAEARLALAFREVVLSG